MPFDPRFLPDPAIFPNLQATGFVQTSPNDSRYNCFAWAMGEQRMVWDPMSPNDAWWPPTAPRALNLDAFVAAFATRGYQLCNDGSYEDGFEKISIFTLNGIVKHAARQLNHLHWTSKLGKSADITHMVTGVDGQLYGTVVAFMRRPRATSS